MSTNKIDEMTEQEAKALLNDICAEIGIGGRARTHSVVMTNISNALRRSACLTRIENVHVETYVDEDGERVEESLLNWGQNPEDYLATYKKVVGI